MNGRFQFRLGTLLFVVVPYLAIYAAVMSALIRAKPVEHYTPSPPPTNDGILRSN